jgi:hypothetical protein
LEVEDRKSYGPKTDRSTIQEEEKIRIRRRIRIYVKYWQRRKSQKRNHEYVLCAKFRQLFNVKTGGV